MSDESDHPCDVAYRAGVKAAKDGQTEDDAKREAHNKSEDPESFMAGYWDQVERMEREAP